MIIAGLGFYTSGGDVTNNFTLITGEGLVLNVTESPVVVAISEGPIVAVAGPGPIVITIPGG